MKKLFCVMSLIAAFAAVSCNKDKPEPEVKPEKLSAPVLAVSEQDETHFTVSWNAVENATSYYYSVNGENETSTAELSFSVSDPVPGEYKIKVKAVPSDEKYLESDYAEISVKIEEPEPSMTFSFEIKDLTATTATIVCTPSDLEATYWFDVYLKSDYDKFASDEEFIASIEKELAALGEDEGLSYQEVLEILLSTGEDKWTATSMTPDTEYIAYAFGINTDGTKTTPLTVEVFRTLEDKTDNSWIGTWEAVSDNTLNMTPDGKLSVLDKKTTFRFTVSEVEGKEDRLAIGNWFVDYPEYTFEVAYDKEKDSFDFENFLQLDDPDRDGYTPHGCSFCECDGDYFLIDIDNYQPLTFKNNGDGTASVTGNSTDVDGLVFNPVTYVVFWFSGYSIAPGSQTMPIAPFTITKVESKAYSRMAVR